MVRPLEPSPRIATLAERGRPPGPRIASSAANPVWMIRSSAAGAGSGRCDGTGAGAVAGARARAPSVIGAIASVAVVPAALGAAGSPASLQARHGCRHVRGECRHRTARLEHLFD